MTISEYRFPVEIGDKLPNGAILLDVRPNRRGEFVVLALHAGAGAYEPFCTWQANVVGETYWGHYSTNLTDALEDFEERTL
jgi:hypothetical protein